MTTPTTRTLTSSTSSLLRSLRIPSSFRSPIASSSSSARPTTITASLPAARGAAAPRSRGYSSRAGSGWTRNESAGIRWKRTALLGATGAVLGVTYLLSSPILLDSQISRSKSKSSSSKTKSPNSDDDEEQEELEGTVQPSGQKLISAEEVARHNTREDCWVIIQGNVYDVTEFLEMHPGGAGVILKQAGKDATAIYAPLHPPGTLDEHLQAHQKIGPIDPTTVKAEARELDEDELRVKRARENIPPIDSILNLSDLESLAQTLLSTTAWAYYRSAADSEDSYRNNEASWSRYYFRPRVLRNARGVDPSGEMLGMFTTLPIFIAPAAMAKLGHPLGEVNLTRGAGNCGIVQGISSNASCSLEEMVEAKQQGQKLIFQLYLNKDRAASERLIKKVTTLGCSAIIFTVDAPVPGNRTLDQRAKGVVADAPASAKDDRNKTKAPVGVAQAISGYQDDQLVWEDIEFIKRHTELPIIVKGIQCVEDAEIAAEHGVAGIILSNHGARQLNFSPASIDVLYEIRQRKPELFKKMEIYVDGGVKSGTDVVKALALGAKGVGLGRAFLYANACYGEEGVEKVYEILRKEIITSMALVGARKLEDLKPEMVERAYWMR